MGRLATSSATWGPATGQGGGFGLFTAPAQPFIDSIPISRRAGKYLLGLGIGFCACFEGIILRAYNAVVFGRPESEPQHKAKERGQPCGQIEAVHAGGVGFVLTTTRIKATRDMPAVVMVSASSGAT